jgi:hypothetical protein
MRAHAHKCLNLLAHAADRVAAEALVAMRGACFEKFSSNNNDNTNRRHFRRAQDIANSATELRNCAMQKLQLCDARATSTLRSIIELECSNPARRHR